MHVFCSAVTLLLLTLSLPVCVNLDSLILCNCSWSLILCNKFVFLPSKNSQRKFTEFQKLHFWKWSKKVVLPNLSFDVLLLGKQKKCIRNIYASILRHVDEV